MTEVDLEGLWEGRGESDGSTLTTTFHRSGCSLIAERQPEPAEYWIFAKEFSIQWYSAKLVSYLLVLFAVEVLVSIEFVFKNKQPDSATRRRTTRRDV